MAELQAKTIEMEQDECGENPAVLEYTFMTKIRIIKNLLILAIGFLFLFSAYMSLENLQSTMNSEGSVGVTSQAAIYGTLIVSSLFLPTLLIKRLGMKLTLVISMLTYSPFIAANFYPTMVTMLPTAVLLGLGASNLWVAADSYINELSFIAAKGDITKAALSTSRFFGIFQMFFQITHITGNLVSFYVLSPSNITFENPHNISSSRSRLMLIENISCGAEFCGGMDENVNPLPDSKRSMLIGIFFVFSIIAATILFFFLDSLRPEVQESGDSLLLKLTAAFRHMKKTEQKLLIVLTMFSGLEQSFIFAEYSEAYIACTLGMENIGIVFVCFGITNAITAFTAGRLLKYVPRIAIMLAAAASNIGVCVTLFCWKPNVQQISVFYILISLWGFSDAIWQTQLVALYGVLFRKDEEAAFANYRVWEAFGFFIVYNCSSHLCTSSKIYMQIGSLLVGMTGYIVLEIRIFMKNKSC